MKNLIVGFALVLIAQATQTAAAQAVFEIPASKTYVTLSYFAVPPIGGDTIKILADRTETLKFEGLTGAPGNPIIVINSGGQVNIETDNFGALKFSDCQHIKVTGTGDDDYHYGFRLLGIECGLQFSGYSSDVEAEFIEIRGNDDVFFGIYAKKDFGGEPPVPYPQFNNLIIHDNYIHDVSEGMYIGETTSPGMEFRHVKVYNNIVTDTHRECIQVANGVEDIEIYNNLLVNAGLFGLYGQSNIIQVGGNTVAKVYNNILKTAPDYGIINLGMGDNYLYNNYIEDCKGIFIDDRYIPNEEAPVVVSDNLFLSTDGGEIVRNMNEINPIFIENNQYDTDLPFFNHATEEQPPVLVVENNTLGSIQKLNFTIENGLYFPAADLPEAYKGLGPVASEEDTDDTDDPEDPDPPASPDRIPLQANNVFDLVPGGSILSPLNLVDEQDLDPYANQHPVSKPWIPAKNTRQAPFLAQIELDQLWQITQIMIHDMRKEGAVEVSAFVNGAWIPLFSDACLETEHWNIHEVDCITDQLRLTMSESVKGEFNEIALYGFSASATLKSADLRGSEADLLERFIQRPKLYPNPSEGNVSIVTDWDQPEIGVYTVTGELILTTRQKRFSIAHIENGVYLVKIAEPATNRQTTERLIIHH